MRYYVKFGLEVEAESEEEAWVEAHRVLEDDPGYIDIISVEKDW